MISGKKEAVETACEKLKEAGAKRTIMLNVSGPFHSRMLTGAGEKLGEVLEQVEVHTPPVCSQCDCAVCNGCGRGKTASDKAGFFLCQMGAECPHHAG